MPPTMSKLDKEEQNTNRKQHFQFAGFMNQRVWKKPCLYSPHLLQDPLIFQLSWSKNRPLREFS